MDTVFSRTGSTLDVGGMTATLPGDMSALSLLAHNGFVPGGDYREDGYIYINGSPIRKWYKNIEAVKTWFPILNDIKKLQRRYNVVQKAYHDYWQKYGLPAYKAVMKVGKAHAKITHEFKGDYPPWWLYSASESGISWDWVGEPKKPVHPVIGTRYYKTSQRFQQLGGRVHIFRSVLLRAIRDKVYDIKGSYGKLLQVKVLDSVYWFQHGRHTWELITSDDTFKTVEL